MAETTFADIFENAILAEEKMKEYYLALAARFKRFAEISAFWKGMADDEEQHAGILKNIRASLPGNVLFSLAEAKMASISGKISLSPLRDMLKTVRDLDDAYETAHEWESSELNALFMLLASKFIDVAERKNFTKELLKSHVAKLKDFPVKFGDAEQRKLIIGE